MEIINGVAGRKSENERQYRVINQMLSMHSFLRDRYTRRARLLNIGLISGSIFLCAFVFAGDDIFLAFRMSPKMAKILLGFFSVLVLILSIVEAKVEWKGRATLHDEAAQQLRALKLKYREVWTDMQGNDPKKNARLSREYQRVQQKLPPIPEKNFLSLKAEHEFKILLSQRVNQHPKAPVWFSWLQMRMEGIYDAWKHRPPSDTH